MHLRRVGFSETNNKLRYICIFFVPNKDDKCLLIYLQSCDLSQQSLATAQCDSWDENTSVRHPETSGFR